MVATILEGLSLRPRELGSLSVWSSHRVEEDGHSLQGSAIRRFLTPSGHASGLSAVVAALEQSSDDGLSYFTEVFLILFDL